MSTSNPRLDLVLIDGDAGGLVSAVVSQQFDHRVIIPIMHLHIDVRHIFRPLYSKGEDKGQARWRDEVGMQTLQVTYSGGSVAWLAYLSGLTFTT